MAGVWCRCALAWSAVGFVFGSPSVAQNVTPSKARIDQVLASAVEKQKIPGVVAIVGNNRGVVYRGAFGLRRDSPAAPMTIDTIFRIASMTKPVTSVAIMQLIERGVLSLEDPAGKYIPAISQAQVIDHFDSKTGREVLRPPKTPITIAELLTHTSGYVYSQWDAILQRYEGRPPGASDPRYIEPLRFDPGTNWQYGDSTAWLGKIVETINHETLEEYCRKNIFDPLGMVDTSFDVPLQKQGRLATVHQRLPNGTFKELPQGPLEPVKVDRGDGGLYSTAEDYTKFMLMLLNDGASERVQILKPGSVHLMRVNHIGDLTLHEFKSVVPEISADGTVPGGLDKFGYGFALNTKPVPGGRGAGSMAWAGIDNTYFWIDPTKKTVAVIMMQILPFIDPDAIEVLREFEQAVYASQRD